MIIGILTVEGSNGISGNRANFKDIIRTGKKMGVPVYVVPIETINFKKKTCTGYKWKSQWEKTILPIPNVFYNRISTRRAERRPDVQLQKDRIKQEGIPIFNPHFFNKQVLYEIVGENPNTKLLLPETRKFTLPNLRAMLNKYGKVYVKPIHSKAGKGIVRVDKVESSTFVHTQKNGQRITHSIPLTKIYRQITQNKKFNGYVLQRSIELAKIEEHPFDLRILMQKDGNGEWGSTGIGARVAPLHGIVTHVPNGGSIRTAEEVLEASFHQEGKMILENVKEQALLLANVIEQSTDGIMGEMSIDIGIDKAGKPWFFEANAKPMKFDEPDIRELSLQRLIEYSKYLANKNTDE